MDSDGLLARRPIGACLYLVNVASSASYGMHMVGKKRYGSEYGREDLHQLMPAVYRSYQCGLHRQVGDA